MSSLKETILSRGSVVLFLDLKYPTYWWKIFTSFPSLGSYRIETHLPGYLLGNVLLLSMSLIICLLDCFISFYLGSNFLIVFNV